MTIQELAHIAYSYFENAKRSNGDEFVRTKDDTPEWIRELVHNSHGEFLPDDWRYKTIQSALGFIADYEGDDLDDALGDAVNEFAGGEVDVYTGARFAWLSSNLTRQNYVDDAVSEYGNDPERGIAEMVGLGQYAEAEEVFTLVRSALEARAAAEENATS